MDSHPPATAPGASGRLARLAAARVAVQALGFLWFVYAARRLGASELGVLSSGLALVVVLGGMSDLGTTRTIVRHVAAVPSSLRANLGRAVRLRLGAGVALGAAATAVLPLLSDLRPEVVALAAWIAVASGTTEVDFAALRSIGGARSEVRVLILERTSFTVLAVSALALGRGPLVVLALYGLTNTASAVGGAVMAHRLGPGATPAEPFFDGEGRRTALSSTLLIVAPRVSIVVLVLMGTAPAVAAFAVAQKPTEALALLVVAGAAPVLPILRAKVVAGRGADASRVAGHLAGAGLAASGGLVGWFVADPQGVLALLLGGGSTLGGAPVMRTLALGVVLVLIRGALELLLLAHEQAGQLVWATSAALVVTVVVGVATIPAHGPSGAAWAAVAGEAVGLLIVGRGAWRRAGRSDLLPPVLLGASVAVLTASVVWVLQLGDLGGLGIATAATLLGLVLARRNVVALDRLSG